MQNILKILIIGQNSYIGRSFAEYMSENHPGEAEITMAGARDGSWRRTDFAGFDVILHAAALVHKKETPRMKKDYYQVNAKMPFDVAKKAKHSGVGKFVFLSTMAVYDDREPLITKDTKENPRTLYGKSKRKAELYLKELAGTGFQVIVLRPPMVYGKGCPGNYGRLSSLSLKLPVLPKVENRRSMIYVENLCECIYRSIKKEMRPYCVVQPQNGSYVNTIDLMTRIRKAHGKKTFVIPVGGRFIRLLAGKISVFQKVFGNCCYKRDGKESSYRVADFEDSIARTEN